MTVVLIAVYVPVAFQGGLTGALFTEFAFTLVGAVTISAVVALTLSPMMSSRLLKARGVSSAGWSDRLTGFIDRAFESLHRRYRGGCTPAWTICRSPSSSCWSCCPASTFSTTAPTGNWRRRKIRA